MDQYSKFFEKLSSMTSAIVKLIPGSVSWHHLITFILVMQQVMFGDLGSGYLMSENLKSCLEQISNLLQKNCQSSIGSVILN